MESPGRCSGSGCVMGKDIRQNRRSAHSTGRGKRIACDGRSTSDGTIGRKLSLTPRSRPNRGKWGAGMLGQRPRATGPPVPRLKRRHRSPSPSPIVALDDPLPSRHRDLDPDPLLKQVPSAPLLRLRPFPIPRLSFFFRLERRLYFRSPTTTPDSPPPSWPSN